jgi:hypothetical protein
VVDLTDTAQPVAAPEIVVDCDGKAEEFLPVLWLELTTHQVFFGLEIRLIKRAKRTCAFLLSDKPTTSSWL